MIKKPYSPGFCMEGNTVQMQRKIKLQQSDVNRDLDLERQLLASNLEEQIELQKTKILQGAVNAVYQVVISNAT